MEKKFYKGNWNNAQDECMLCNMTKKTEWYFETPNLVVAEKITGGPFVVWKSHKTELDEDEMKLVEHVVDLLFDEWEIMVTMSQVENHWHGHLIIDDEKVDLSDE